MKSSPDGLAPHQIVADELQRIGILGAEVAVAPGTGDQFLGTVEQLHERLPLLGRCHHYADVAVPRFVNRIAARPESCGQRALPPALRAVGVQRARPRGDAGGRRFLVRDLVTDGASTAAVAQEAGGAHHGGVDPCAVQRQPGGRVCRAAGAATRSKRVRRSRRNPTMDEMPSPRRSVTVTATGAPAAAPRAWKTDPSASKTMSARAHSPRSSAASPGSAGSITTLFLLVLRARKAMLPRVDSPEPGTRGLPPPGEGALGGFDEQDFRAEAGPDRGRRTPSSGCAISTTLQTGQQTLRHRLALLRAYGTPEV